MAVVVGWRSGYSETGCRRYTGNYSGATFGDPSETLYRYIDDLYLSTTLDR